MTIIRAVFTFILMQQIGSCIAQESETYRFVVKEKVMIDSSTGLYHNSEFEYKYKRVFLSDSSFKEVGLFTGDDRKQTACHFKIKDGSWYIKSKNKWELFYSLNKQVSPSVQIAGRLHNLKYIRTEDINGHSCVIYKSELVNGQSGGEIYYWFNPQKGIVMLKADDVVLIREDLIAK